MKRYYTCDRFQNRRRSIGGRSKCRATEMRMHRRTNICSRQAVDSTHYQPAMTRATTAAASAPEITPTLPATTISPATLIHQQKQHHHHQQHQHQHHHHTKTENSNSNSNSNSNNNNNNKPTALVDLVGTYN